MNVEGKKGRPKQKRLNRRCTRDTEDSGYVGEGI